MESNECSQHFASDHFQLYGCKGPVDVEPCGSSVHRNTDREHILNILLVLPILQIMTMYTHRIHGTSIFTYIWLMFMVNVGEYRSPMDPI